MPEYKYSVHVHHVHVCTFTVAKVLYLHSTHVACTCLMREERRKEERSKQGQTNNKAKQHSTPTAVTFPTKNELPRVELEPTTLYTLDMYMYACYDATCNYSWHGMRCIPYLGCINNLKSNFPPMIMAM